MFKFNVSRLYLKISCFKCSNSLHTSLVNSNSLLSELRKKTGLSFVLCKKALKENENDLNNAEKWLKEEVKRIGLEKSQKMTFRKADQGLIGVYVNNEKNRGVLIEVNCETDFVAKNSKFIKLVSNLTKDLFNSSKKESTLLKNNISKIYYNKNDLLFKSDIINETITYLGEKITFNRTCVIDNFFGKDVNLIGYAHSTFGGNNIYDDVLFGKYGTIVAFRNLEDKIENNFKERSEINSDLNNKSNKNNDLLENNEEEFDEEPLTFDLLTKQICQHIIVMNPEYIKDEPNINKDTIQLNETKVQFPKALYAQDFLHDDNLKVEDILKSNNCEILDFVKLKCGETEVD